MILVENTEQRLNYRLSHRQFQLLQHQVQLKRRNVPIFIFVIFIEQPCQQKLVVSSF